METENISQKLSWHQKISNKILLAIILAGVLPILFFATFVGFKVRNDLLTESTRSQHSKTTIILQGMKALLDDSISRIQLLSQEPGMQKQNYSIQSSLLQNFLKTHSLFFSCYYYNASGEVICSAFRNRKHSDKNKLIRNIFNSDTNDNNRTSDEFSKIIKSKKPAFSGHIISSLKQKMLLVMVPVFDFIDPEKVTGVLSFAISLSSPSIHEIISGYPLMENEVVALLDRKGNVISANGKLPQGFAGVNISKKLSETIESATINIELSGVNYIGTLVKSPITNGFLFLARPQSLVLAFLSQLLLDLALVFLITIALTASAGFFLSKTLSEGITNLIIGIKQVAIGVIAHRVEIGGDDEIAEAGNAFNEMAATLEKHRLMNDIWSQEWKNKNTSSKTNNQE